MRLRRGPMALLGVLLVGVPILEVLLLVQVGRKLGVWPTLAILVVEAALGAWLVRREGSRARTALTEAVRRGRMLPGELADPALMVVGGLLLLLPGFVTDLVGLFFLLPFTRPLARRVVQLLVLRRLGRMTAAGMPSGLGGTVVEGEVVPPTEPSVTVLPGQIEPHPHLRRP